MLEIERKFLINTEEWKKVKPEEGLLIRQGYIFDSSKGVLRVRTKGEKAFLTLKSATFSRTRMEFEYEIPMDDALTMITEMCDVTLSKTRYLYEFEGKQWEIDEFHEELSPLVLAEIELDSEDEVIHFPSFIEEEVTSNQQYYNSELIKQIKK